MKKTLYSIMAAGAFGPAAFGLMNLGEGQVNLNLHVSSFYDTEIRARNLGQEDFVFSVRPYIEYVRSSKNLDFSASAGLDSVTYLDYGEFDQTDFFFDLDISPSASMETSRFRFSGDLILNSETKSENSVGEIVTINNYGASAQLAYDPNRHYTVTGTLAYRQRDPDSDRYFATENVTASVKVDFPVQEDVLLDAGIRYLDTSTDGPTADSETFTYFIGVSGTLMPKVTGSLDAGIQNRKFDAGGSSDAPYFSADLTWLADERSSISLTATHDLGTTIDDRATENTSLRLSGNRQLSRELSANVYIGYEKDQYESASTDPDLQRDDKATTAGASLRYQIVRWGSLALEMNYRDQSSNSDLYDYDRFRVGLTFLGTW